VGIQRDFLRPGDFNGRGWCFQGDKRIIEDPESCRPHGCSLGHHGNDAEGYGRQRHDCQQAVQLPRLRSGVSEPGAQCLFFQYDRELLVSFVDDSLAFHACRDGSTDVVGCAEEVNPEGEHGRCVVCGLEQSRYDVVLVDAERLGLFVQRQPVWPEDAFHSRPGLAPELDIGRLHGAGGGGQVRDLVFCVAGAAPVADVFTGGGLDAVLDFADAGEVLSGGGGEGAS
jgi:hypothetical protein